MNTATTCASPCATRCIARVAGKLLHGIDHAKHGQFNYHRCLQKHGRFTTFGQFMIEKGFVRQLPGRDHRARRSVGTIRCMGCGAPVDIRNNHACTHCRAPIAILDADAVEQALARYQHAEIKRTTINVDALGDAIVTREREKSRRNREQPRGRTKISKSATCFVRYRTDLEPGGSALGVKRRATLARLDGAIRFTARVFRRAVLLPGCLHPPSIPVCGT
jgi:hypothetical protein